jgi:hypothetical protein
MGNPRELSRVGSSRSLGVAAIVFLAVGLLGRTAFAGDAGAEAAAEAGPDAEEEAGADAEPDTGPTMEPLGAPCTTSENCSSGNCVDFVCCNNGCGGQCQACNSAGSMGTCVTIKGPPTGTRPACPQSDPSNVCSSKVCDGTSATSCTSLVGNTTTCGIATCVDGFGTPGAVCEGDGGCQKVSPTSCGLFACISDQCATSCNDTSECSPGNYCNVTKRTCEKPAPVPENADGSPIGLPSAVTESGCSIGSPSRGWSPFLMLMAVFGTWSLFRRRRR